MKKKFRVTKGWFSELSTTESTFHFNDERIKFVKWSTFLFHSNAIRATNSCNFSDCWYQIALTLWFDLIIISSQLFHQIFLTLNKLSQGTDITRNATVPIFEEDRRMCQYSRNNSIQFSSWTMIPLSWFPNFHILWVWTQEAESPSYPCVRSKIWSRDFVCVPWTQSEWITFCTCQSDKNTPRSQADCNSILWFIQATAFHVWFLNDFQFLSRAELTQKATKMFQCCYFHWNIIYLPHERI